MFLPGLAIFITVLAFNLFGDGLRDALDPRQPVSRRTTSLTWVPQEVHEKGSQHAHDRKRVLVAVIAAAACLGLSCLRASSNDDGGNDDRANGSGNKARRPGVVNPSDAEGRHPEDGHRRELGLASTRATPTTATRGTSAALLRAHADDVQAGAGQGRATAGPDLADRAPGKPTTAARPGPTSSATGLKFEDGIADHVQGRQVRRRARHFARTCCSARPDLLQATCSTAATSTRARTRTRPDNGPRSIETPDDTTIVFHLKQAVRGLRLPGRHAATGPGAGRPRTPA